MRYPSNRRVKLALGAGAALAALVASSGCDLQEDRHRARRAAVHAEVRRLPRPHRGRNQRRRRPQPGPRLRGRPRLGHGPGRDRGGRRVADHEPRPASEDVKVYMPANLVEGEDAATSPPTSPASPACPGSSPEFIAPEFFATNCGGCHTLSAAGTTGTVGPSLDDVLPGQSPGQVFPSRSPTPRPSSPPGFPRRRDARQIRWNPHPRAAAAARPLPAAVGRGRRQLAGRRPALARASESGSEPSRRQVCSSPTPSTLLRRAAPVPTSTPASPLISTAAATARPAPAAANIISTRKASASLRKGFRGRCCSMP